MSHPRRDFLKRTAGIAGALTLASFLDPLYAEELKTQSKRVAAMSPEAAASDEDFWGWVRESYTVSPNIINLNNGGVSPSPIPVQNAHKKYLDLANEGPSYYMWEVIDKGRESVRMKLAELAGCSPEELAINRNSTEALNSIIFGLNMQPGDEVLISKYDYPSMENAWKQREKRDGIKLVWVDLTLPYDNDNDVIEAYKKAITPKTKIIHVTHVINWTGQIMPAKKLADLAHQHGCEIILDCAHSFAHLEYTFPELDCDYSGVSLHKWLCAPFGSGLLYVKKKNIQKLWPLLSNVNPESDDIRKFESIGTRNNGSEMAIGYAVDFHNIIGGKRKQARLQYLKNYWAEKISKIPKVSFHTSLNPRYSCALCTFRIEGWKGNEIKAILFDKYKIFTAGIDYEKLAGVRVSPNVYTNIDDLDRLVKGINEIAASDAPVAKKEGTK
jgi:selenocysteine lyase/cysteine desulfurase